MDKRIRYSLIAAGVIVFLTAAPLIVLFVRGIKYDFQEKKFIRTGILAVKAEPEDASVYLDGRLAKDSSGEIRFLNAGNYQVSLKKAGFFEWNKNLAILPNVVTPASPENRKIHLLRKNPPPELIQKDVQDVAVWTEGVLALSGSRLTIAETWDLANPKTFALPEKVSKIIPSPDFRLFLLVREAQGPQNAQVLLFDRRREKLFDLRSLFESPGKLPAFDFSQNGRLLAFSGSALYEINPETPRRQLLMSNLQTAQVIGNTLYFLEQKGNQSELKSLDLETNIAQTLATGLPGLENALIFTSLQKRVFLAADARLYEVSTEGLRLIAENIKAWSNKKHKNTFVFFAAGELRFLDEWGENRFVTRLSDAVSLPEVFAEIGYVFFDKNGQLTALELDQGEPQNSYRLYSGSKIEKYFLDDAAKNLLVLDSGQLKKIMLR